MSKFLERKKQYDKVVGEYVSDIKEANTDQDIDDLVRKILANGESDHEMLMHEYAENRGVCMYCGGET